MSDTRFDVDRLRDLLHVHPVHILRNRVDLAAETLWDLQKYLPKVYRDILNEAGANGPDERRAAASKALMMRAPDLRRDAWWGLVAASRAAVGTGLFLDYAEPGNGGAIETKLRTDLDNALNVVQGFESARLLCSDDPKDPREWDSSTNSVSRWRERLAVLGTHPFSDADVADRFAKISRLHRAFEAYEKECRCETAPNPEYPVRLKGAEESEDQEGEDLRYLFDDVTRSLSPIAAWIEYTQELWHKAEDHFHQCCFDRYRKAHPEEDADGDDIYYANIIPRDETEYEQDFITRLIEFLGSVLKVSEGSDVLRQVSEAEEAAGTGNTLTREDTLNLPDAPSGDFVPLPNEKIMDAVKEALTKHAKEGADVQSKSAKRPKKGDEKWRRAQKRLLDRLEQETLPKTIRDAAKAIEFKYGTTRRAVKKSATLRAYFGNASDTENSAGNPSSVLDELAQQADPETRKLIQEMAPERRKEAESACQAMPPERRVEIFKTLTSNPDTQGKLHGMATLDLDEQDPTSKDYVPKGARRRERRAGSRREDD